MPYQSFSGSVSTPQVNLGIDFGNHFLNRTVDGFLKIGTVAAAKTAADGAYHVVRKGSFSKKNLEQTLKKMCKDGAYWGTVAGVYTGMEYGAGRVLGTSNWTNAMIGGAATGALMAAATSKEKDKIVMDAIAGAAIATGATQITPNFPSLKPPSLPSQVGLVCCRVRIKQAQLG